MLSALRRNKVVSALQSLKVSILVCWPSFYDIVQNMKRVILYPTETLYALGVNALDSEEIKKLYELKERTEGKAASWLVRCVEDIEKYAELPGKAVKIAEKFLPGQLTLVLKVKKEISDEVVAKDRTIGFRVSADPKAQELIAKFMEENNAPLTCTSANISGSPTLGTPSEILQQFGPKAGMIDEIIDDGPRKGLASTVIRVIGEDVKILREGEISEWDIRKVLM